MNVEMAKRILRRDLLDGHVTKPLTAC